MSIAANTLLASAIAGGNDRLSQRDVLICIAYLYASGNTATVQLAAAIASGFDRLSNGDVKKCIAEVLNP